MVVDYGSGEDYALNNDAGPSAPRAAESNLSRNDAADGMMTLTHASTGTAVIGSHEVATDAHKNSPHSSRPKATATGAHRGKDCDAQLELRTPTTSRTETLRPSTA